MITIHKYPLEITDWQSVETREGARPLCIKVQHGQPCLWCIVDDSVEKASTLTIRCAGTGHNLQPPENCRLKYMDTILMHDGNLVLHFFLLEYAREKTV